MAPSAALARYVASSSGTPTARSSLEAAIKTLRFLLASAPGTLAPLGAATDIPLPATGPDPSAAPELRIFRCAVATMPGGGADDSDRTELTSVAARLHGDFCTPRPRPCLLLSFPVAANGNGGDCSGSGALMSTRPISLSATCTLARFFPAAIRPGYRSALCSDRSLTASSMVPGLHVYRPTFPLAAPKVCFQ